MFEFHNFDRCHLTVVEQHALFKKGLEDELARATAHLTAPLLASRADRHNHKVMAAAYRIVARVPHDTAAIPHEIVESEIDDRWTPPEIMLLWKVLQFLVTPMSVSRTSAKEDLQALGAPVNDGTCREGRSHLLRGYAEAHLRVGEAHARGIDIARLSPIALLDENWSDVAQTIAAPPTHHVDDEMPLVSQPEIATVSGGNLFFAKITNVRFSEQLEELHETMFEDHNWQPDNGKTRHMLEVFAWLTGDKAMSDYEPADIKEYVRRLRRIPKGFNWGRLHVKGAMAEPFDPASYPILNPSKRRSDRTINSHLTKLQSASNILKLTYWMHRHGFGMVMNFQEARKRIEADDSDPKRMPLTEKNLVAIYGLPLWQGGGGCNARVKPAQTPMVYQDAAYWVPLLGTYAGMSREEACGLELADVEIDAVTPYVLVRANMTKSKDGKTPGGLKRSSRRRALPLHTELLRLGFADYVAAIKEEGWDRLFPELYGKINKEREYVRWMKPGGPRFYGTAWRYIIDAAHAIAPLPQTSDGKHADFHSQRTFHYSAMAGEGVSEALLARHVGHSGRTTGAKNYNRRALALGEEKELAERMAVLQQQVLSVTSHVPKPTSVSLLPINKRSRVGSALGRNAAKHFLA
jgi:integrase